MKGQRVNDELRPPNERSDTTSPFARAQRQVEEETGRHILAWDRFDHERHTTLMREMAGLSHDPPLDKRMHGRPCKPKPPADECPDDSD